MKTFKVSSGKWSKTIRATSATRAAANAIKQDAPKNLGALTMIESEGDATLFWDTREALKLAGIRTRSTVIKAAKRKREN